MELAQTIRNTRVPPGRLAMLWLGQAGFVLKDTQGALFAIDPYLSNCGERIKADMAFRRLTPKLIAPEDFAPDLYLVTHHHFDHYDYDAIPVVAQNGKTVFCGPRSCTELLGALPLEGRRILPLAPGASVAHAGIRLTAVEADHGTLAPDAIGALVEMGGLRLYFSGDTSYRPGHAAALAGLRPDVAVLSINGRFGNMDAAEGAALARQLGVKTAIPCHFGTFLAHEGQPWEFVRLLQESAGCRPLCLQMGAATLLGAEGTGAE